MSAAARAPAAPPGVAPEPASSGRAIFLCLALALLAPGLVGHDPWKQDEAYVFGAVQHVLETGDWVVPHVGGEPFMEKPPLYYLAGALSAWLLSPWLAIHDGARVAAGFFTALACVAVARAASLWWGPGTARFAVLALAASLGILVHGHMMLPDVPVATGFALVAWGFALVHRRPRVAGLLIGTGAGMGFLAKGMLAPGVLGVAALLLPLCFRHWRVRACVQALAVAALASLPWLLVWPAALYMRSPALFHEWFWINNIGRFLGFAVPALGAAHEPGLWLKTIPWFAFPALPLACLACVRLHRDPGALPPMQFCIVTASVLMGVLSVSASGRENYALPVLVPLAILAAPAAAGVPVRVDRAWAWTSLLVFGLIAAWLWGAWADAVLHGGSVAGIPWAQRLPLEFFRPRVPWFSLASAVAVTALALFVALRLDRLRASGLVAWSAGLAMCWGLLATLWLPWVDTAKSYRGMFMSMARHMPQAQRCIASRGLGESERAMLHYVLGIDTLRQEVDARAAASCDLLLVQGRAALPARELQDSAWRLAWDGARPADRRERFWLFVPAVRADSAASASGRAGEGAGRPRCADQPTIRCHQSP